MSALVSPETESRPEVRLILNHVNRYDVPLLSCPCSVRLTGRTMNTRLSGNTCVSPLPRLTGVRLPVVPRFRQCRRGQGSSDSGCLREDTE